MAGKKLTVLFWGLGLMGLLQGVTAQETFYQKALSSITAGELSEHVHILASERMEGRFTGSEGQQLAAEYISRQLAKDGLVSPYQPPRPAFLQTFTLDKCYWKEQTVSVAGIHLNPVKDFTFLSQPGELSGDYEVIFAGLGLDDSAWSDYSGLDVRGKVVLVFNGEPRNKDGNYVLSGNEKPTRNAGYSSKIGIARKMGASGMILVNTDQQAFRKSARDAESWMDQPVMFYPGEEREDFFVLYLALEQAAFLVDLKPAAFRKAGLMLLKGGEPAETLKEGRMALSTKMECYPMNTENVVGYIEGTDKKHEAVVVVAHYDHHGRKEGKIYPGADDNASGTAAMMEIAEAFALAAKEGQRPRRSVIFLAATAEEIGLYGSRYYADHPLVSIDSTYACLNIDMIGRVGDRFKDETDYIGGWTYLSTELLEITRQSFQRTAPELAFKMNLRLQTTGGSDHYYFSKEGVPSVFFFTGIHKDYHTPGDTPDKLLYGRMEKIVRSIFATAWELANREESWPEK